MRVRNKVMKKVTFRRRTTNKSQGLDGRDIFMQSPATGKLRLRIFH